VPLSPVDQLGGVLGARLEGGVDHLHDEALPGLRQPLDALDLLQELGGGAAPGGPGFLADQFLDRDGQGAGEPGQKGELDATAADFPGGDNLLGDTQFLGELGLGEIEGLAGSLMPRMASSG